MVFYSNKVTVMSGDYEIETKNVKLTFFQFNMSKATLEHVVGSKYFSRQIQLKNSVFTSYKDDGIVVVSVLDQLTQQASNHMTFHLYSQAKTAGKNWKMAYLLLPTVLHDSDSCKYQVQSCVVISDHLYCSLWLHETTAYIYEINLLPLSECDKEYYEGSLPERNWVVEDLFIQGCYLSALEEKVVATTFKNINDRTVMEVRLFNSTSVTSVVPKPVCQHDFLSIIKVSAVSAISGDRNTLAVVYHDNKINKCYATRLKMPP